MKKNLSVYVLLIAAVSVLSACAGAALGVGASAGVAAAQDRGIGGAFSDTRIKALITDRWFKHDLSIFAKLGLTVNEGRVLITGVVQKPEQRVEAVRLAWQVSGVKEVINEIRVAESTGISGFARDTWITTRLRAEITFDKDIRSVNYSIDTVQGTVYLMGVSRNQAELNRVIQIARTIPDVRQVVSYTKMAGQDVNAPMNIAPNESGTNDGGYIDDTSSSAGGAPLVPPPVESERLN
jgi:osmotically-inducible protein OsmY